MNYGVVSHFSGVTSQPLDLTARLPWVYVIVASEARVVYIGETYDPNGLVVRLSSHFGPYVNSTLRQRAAEVAGQNPLRAPFFVVAARLPLADDDVAFDGSSKQNRLLCETILHELISIRFVGPRMGWAMRSTPQPPSIQPTRAITDACVSLVECFQHSMSFLGGLVGTSSFQLVLLDLRREIAEPVADMGAVITQIELRLHGWLMTELKAKFGENWWTEGVPAPTRIECVKRREEEGMGERMPRDAYLTLIDLRAIAQKNWDLFGKVLERVAQEKGKDKGTAWFVELNEVRKLWAHPLKQLYMPVEPVRIAALRNLHARVTGEIPMPQSKD